MQFNFGKNWKNFLDTAFDETRLSNAEKSLKSFLQMENLEGKTFMDIGCGSGIFSLSAFKLGAAKVISIDVNKEAVDCCLRLKAKAGNPDNWEIHAGSLIDDKFVQTLPQADIVYCWGVAHHTGNMWQALNNLLLPLKDGGYLFVAIYNTVYGFWNSVRWEKIKKFYNYSAPWVKKLMEYGYISFKFVRIIAGGHNPLAVIKNYKDRGMDWKTDLIDWLGGYPYESANIKEMFEFYTNKHGLELKNIKSTNYSGCNQFLFKK